MAGEGDIEPTVAKVLAKVCVAGGAAAVGGDARMTNARMSHRQVKKFCALDDAGESLLKQAMVEMGLSARAHDKILRTDRR